MKKHEWVLDPAPPFPGMGPGPDSTYPAWVAYHCRGCDDWLIMDSIHAPIMDQIMADHEILEDCDEHAVYSLMED